MEEYADFYMRTCRLYEDEMYRMEKRPAYRGYEVQWNSCKKVAGHRQKSQPDRKVGDYLAYHATKKRYAAKCYGACPASFR